jgi:FKBP-type peptidyl-prolyl cis-trans isomerase SlyD
LPSRALIPCRSLVPGRFRLEKEDITMSVAAGQTVSLEYTLRDDQGQVLDSNVDGEPLSYVQGEQEILPKLEEALLGLQVGGTKKVVLSPEDGYGEIDKEAIVEVPLERIPEDARQVGTRLQGQASDGRVVTPVVVEVREDSALLDFNHPLAGMTLEFEVKILGVDNPSGPDKEAN